MKAWRMVVAAEYDPLKLSDGERAFETYWKVIAPTHPMPVMQYKFHADREWKFDFAWPNAHVAVEIMGGVWVKGAHVRGGRYEKDCEKLNVAQAEGNWQVYYLTPGMLEAETDRWINLIAEVVKWRGR